jgi:hypothetical protein
MRRQCQFTVKWSEKRVDLTVAPEQQPRGVQVMKWGGLVRADEFVEKLKTLIYKTLPLFWPDSLIITVQD